MPQLPPNIPLAPSGTRNGYRYNRTSCPDEPQTGRPGKASHSVGSQSRRRRLVFAEARWRLLVGRRARPMGGGLQGCACSCSLQAGLPSMGCGAGQWDGLRGGGSPNWPSGFSGPSWHGDALARGTYLSNDALVSSYLVSRNQKRDYSFSDGMSYHYDFGNGLQIML